MNHMNIDVRHLRQFLAVAEEESFSAAARRLGMAQPPLSQAIAKLEERLGARLFLRTSRSVSLTDPGRVLLDQARDLIAQHERVVRSVRRCAEGASGELSIAFVMSVGSAYLPAILRDFRQAKPSVDLLLAERTTAEQVEALSAGDCDVGLLRPPLYGAKNLVVRTLLEEPLLVALPADHGLAACKRIALDRLREEDFIAPPPKLGPGLHAEVVRLCLESGFAPRIVQEARQMQTIAALVAGGLGVALVPRSVTALGLEGVVYRPVTSAASPAKTEVALAWRPDTLRRRPYLGAFIAAAERLARAGG